MNNLLGLNFGKKDNKEKNNSKKYKILLVENDFELREYIKHALNEHYNIIEAIDGIEGWKMVQRYMPDLIIGDVEVPATDSIQFCKKIKSDFNTCHIPVVLLTTSCTIGELIEGLEIGADSYLFKPFTFGNLLNRVEKLLGQRQVLYNKFSKNLNFEAQEMTLTSSDERIVQKAINLVKENISNSGLKIEDLGSKLGMSRVHTYRKLKELTNLTPTEFIRTIRMKQAAYLLIQNKVNVSEIAYAVGFNSHQYFTNCFQNYFGMSPTDFCQRKHKESIGVAILESI